MLKRKIDSLKNKYFVFFFLLCMCDNVLGQSSWVSFLMTAGIVALVAYCQSLLVTLWGKITSKWWLNLPLIVFVVIDNALLVADSFIYFTFGSLLDLSTLDIILETTAQESLEFCKNYFTPGLIVLLAFSLIAINALCAFIASKSRAVGKTVVTISAILLLVGMGTMAKCVHDLVVFRNGGDIPQLTSYTRVAFWSYVSYRNIRGVQQLEKLADDYIPGDPERDKPDIILIIGESHSLYHSSLYDYEIDTNPLLRIRRNNGELVVFSDAVTSKDHTHGVMHSIYSPGVRGHNFFNIPTLPMIMHKAGFRTSLLDNQYILNHGGGITFLSSVELSEKMFDRRNTHEFRFDGELIDQLDLSDSQSDFAIIHLIGQHYLYKERYPMDDHSIPIEYFPLSTHNGNETINHYDNSCLYTDYIINRLMDRLNDANVCIVYISDHGEDLGAQNGYYGHGNAAFLPDFKYQIRVPMFVWGSRRFIDGNPNLWQSICKASHKKVTTDDLPHFIMDLADIKSDWLDLSRSVISEQYDSLRPRIVLNSIVFDK